VVLGQRARPAVHHPSLAAKPNHSTHQVSPAPHGLHQVLLQIMVQIWTMPAS
jgi:hypothetical protein